VESKEGQNDRQSRHPALRENELERKVNLAELLDTVKNNFGTLSLEALSKNTEQFFQIAKDKLDSERQLHGQELDGKKALIDQQLGHMTEELRKVSDLVKALEEDRIQKFGELRQQLETAADQTAALTQVTSGLREALASSKARGSRPYKA
jgi:DNA recombination protein RmuC